MLLPHAMTLARARLYVASLADQASSDEASSAYEHVLIELDRVHGDDCPAIYYESLADDPANLLRVAASAIEQLELYGADPLSIELVLAMLDDAYLLNGT